MPLEQTLLFILGLISALLYSMIVRTLRKHRKTSLLGGTFFKLVELQFYAELVFFIEFSITMRFRKYTDFYMLFEPDTVFIGIIPRIISGIHYYIKLVVYIGYLFFAVNRLFTALMVSSYDKDNISVWGTKTLQRIAIVQWSIPILGLLPTHAWPNFDFYLLITPTAMRLNNDAVSTALIAYIDGMCCLVTCAFCMICYIITMILIKKNWKKSSNTVFKKTGATAERSLFISSFLSFCVLMLNLTVQILKICISLGGMTNIFSVYDVSYPMVDLMYSHYPWVLLVTSSVLRRQLIYDVKMLIRNSLKLDEASMSLSRGGQTNAVSKTTPAT
ncbi:Serpentine receptor class gamma [Caenorhabditis elegans]|uniref:Serpentine receptor class gamma n=1 Tax=Caenorhabditis elegans TaxID=6239 RepID=Q22937_CAEEL|nr:Serpentine receptor class gamma [Caenorhabditis elegans]CCD65421.1 Serpentine receptor class gamma [Caenorhabditis elegans]|eukprot:NP_508728.3 Serpentine Receptor, class V [Caenorhabditis elegans]